MIEKNKKPKGKYTEEVNKWNGFKLVNNKQPLSNKSKKK